MRPFIDPPGSSLLDFTTILGKGIALLAQQVWKLFPPPLEVRWNRGLGFLRLGGKNSGRFFARAINELASKLFFINEGHLSRFSVFLIKFEG